MKYFASFFFLVFFISSCTSPTIVEIPSDSAKEYLITNARVFTGIKSNLVLNKAFIHIKDGLIAKIYKQNPNLNRPIVIDAKGKTVLPGFTDFHTHITAGMLVPWKMSLLPTPEFNLEAALYSGITNVIDLSGNSPHKMNSIANDLKSGSLAGPRLFHAGIGFTGKNSHPITYISFIKDNMSFLFHPFIPDIAVAIGSPDDLKNVDTHLLAQPDFTKVFYEGSYKNKNLLSKKLLKEIIKRSHDKNIPVVAHIKSNANLRNFIEAGGDGIVHMVYSEPLDPSLAKKMARKKMFVVPTVVLFHNYYEFQEKRSYNHYLPLEYETMHPSRRSALKDPHPEDVVISEHLKKQNHKFHKYKNYFHSNVSIFNKNGVTILAGSDAPNYGITIGGSLHRELMHLVKGGLSNTQALLAVTSEPARILKKILPKKNINFGRIKEGLSADFIIVNGNPMKNIKDTQKIHEVFLKGKRVIRKPMKP